MTEYDTRFEEVRRLVFDYEKGLRSNFANETRIFKNMCGHGYIFEYNSGFNGAYEMGDGKRKRRNRKSIIENYFKSRNRGRNAENGNKEFRSGSNEERVKYSLKHSLDWVDWDDYSTERTESLVKKVTELEKINEDLRLQIRHPGQRHIVSLLETQRVMRELVSG